MLKKTKAIGTPKKSARTILFVIIALALVAAAGTYELLSASKTVIYVFNDDFKAGNEITQNMLVSTEADTSFVNHFDEVSGGKGYVTSNTIGEVVGSYLAQDVSKGSPLYKSATSKYAGTTAEVKLEDSKVAMTVPVDNISVGGPDARSGSYVNVYAGFSQNNVITEELLLEKIKVLDIVYTQLKNDNTNAPVIEGATLEVKAEDTVRLAKAIQFGTIRLGIVKADTYQSMGTAMTETMQGSGNIQTQPDASVQ